MPSDKAMRAPNQVFPLSAQPISHPEDASRRPIRQDRLLHLTQKQT